MHFVMRIFAGGILLFCAIQAHAIPVEFTHTSIVNNSEITGVEQGDTATVTLLADNGGSGLISQSWRIADIISGSLQAGTYRQNYVDNWFNQPSSITFTTNEMGLLTQSNFSGTVSSENHKDIFGAGAFVYLYNGAFQDFFGNFASQDMLLINLSSWTVAEIIEVPEPNAIALLVLGLMGLSWSIKKPKVKLMIVDISSLKMIQADVRRIKL